jgi:hypothetical protein
VILTSTLSPCELLDPYTTDSLKHLVFHNLDTVYYFESSKKCLDESVDYIYDLPEPTFNGDLKNFRIRKLLIKVMNRQYTKMNIYQNMTNMTINLQ